MAGPKMKPRPKAAPTRPMPFARFSGGVMSAITAGAVGIFAPAMPAKMRAAKSSGNDETDANARYDRNDPNRPARMIGRRPMRSESRPQIGAKMNCISENDGDNIPTVSPGAPELAG